MMEEKNIMCFGIDASKDKFDISFTLIGVETFAHKIITNDVSGFKKLN